MNLKHKLPVIVLFTFALVSTNVFARGACLVKYKGANVRADTQGGVAEDAETVCLVNGGNDIMVKAYRACGIEVPTSDSPTGDGLCWPANFGQVEGDDNVTHDYPPIFRNSCVAMAKTVWDNNGTKNIRVGWGHPRTPEGATSDALKKCRSGGWAGNSCTVQGEPVCDVTPN